MPQIIYSSDSDDNRTAAPVKLFQRQRPMHAVLGGGKLADVILWKDKWVSGGIAMGMTLLWILFEVVEYNFVTLFCHISITAMLLLFIWSNGAHFFNWRDPKIPASIVNDMTFREVALSFHRRLNWVLSILLDIASGKDLALFFVAIVSLYILSVIGNYFTFLNFFYFVVVCAQTLPFLYDRYEDEVNYYGDRLIRQAKKYFKRFDSRVLNKIPRGPVKEKKFT